MILLICKENTEMKKKRNFYAKTKENKNFCRCLQANGYCTISGDRCKEGSVKCIRDKSYMKNASLAPNESVKKSGERSKKNSLYSEIIENERYGKNKKISVLNYKGLIITIYVFKGFLRLNKNQTTDYYVYLQDYHTKIKYKLLVAYNMQTGRYYMSDTQIKWLHKNKIFIDAIFCACNEGSEPMNTLDMQAFSKLALQGYRVGKNGLSSPVRHSILRYVIDNKIMKKYEIVEHLQGLISLREDRNDKDFSLAIRSWREDIIYVNNLTSKDNVLK